MNNFYLYRFEGMRLFQFIPWDQDGAFRSLTRVPWETINTNVLATKIWSEPTYRERYLRKLLETADLVGAPSGAPKASDSSTRTCPARPEAAPCGWLEQEVSLGYEQIRAAAYQDPYASFTAAEFEGDVALVQQFARDRADVVRQYVADLAPELLTSDHQSLTGRTGIAPSAGSPGRSAGSPSGRYRLPSRPVPTRE